MRISEILRDAHKGTFLPFHTICFLLAPRFQDGPYKALFYAGSELVFELGFQVNGGSSSVDYAISSSWNQNRAFLDGGTKIVVEEVTGSSKSFEYKPCLFVMSDSKDFSDTGTPNVGTQTNERASVSQVKMAHSFFLDGDVIYGPPAVNLAFIGSIERKNNVSKKHELFSYYVLDDMSMKLPGVYESGDNRVSSLFRFVLDYEWDGQPRAKALTFTKNLMINGFSVSAKTYVGYLYLACFAEMYLNTAKAENEVSFSDFFQRFVSSGQNEAFVAAYEVLANYSSKSNDNRYHVPITLVDGTWRSKFLESFYHTTQNSPALLARFNILKLLHLQSDDETKAVLRIRMERDATATYVLYDEERPAELDSLLVLDYAVAGSLERSIYPTISRLLLSLLAILYNRGLVNADRQSNGSFVWRLRGSLRFNDSISTFYENLKHLGLFTPSLFTLKDRSFFGVNRKAPSSQVKKDSFYLLGDPKKDLTAACCVTESESGELVAIILATMLPELDSYSYSSVSDLLAAGYTFSEVAVDKGFYQGNGLLVTAFDGKVVLLEAENFKLIPGGFNYI